MVVGSRYLILSSVDARVIAQGVAAASTVSVSIPFEGTEQVEVRIRNSTSSTRYLPYSTGGVITNSGLTVFVSQIEDTTLNG